MSYEIFLPIFQGPFDLLLFFIERDELDIYDIPIAKITHDFLDFTRKMEEIDMELAAEFVLVAATLMKIKSRMLLPRQEVDEEGNILDPREELITQLLEYKRIRPMIEELEKLEASMLCRETRGNAAEELIEISKKTGVEAELEEVDLYKLLMAYQYLLSRSKAREESSKIRSIKPYPYTMSGQRAMLLNLLNEKKSFSLSYLFEAVSGRIQMIYLLLVLLESVQLQLITIEVGESYNEVVLSAP